LQVHYSTDRELFFQSTFIHIGNGRSTPFWEAKWLHGAAPKDLAPNLFKSAKFKKRMVHTELRDYNWIKNLKEINSPTLLEEFVLLFLALKGINLTDQKDEIIWRWTTNGKFLVSSAYDCQFHGAMATFPAANTWKAFSKVKCKFLAWLILHNRAPMSDNLQKNHCPCNPICSLCLCQQETAQHLFTQCNYSEALWNSIAAKYNLPGYVSFINLEGPTDWITFIMSSGRKKEKNRKLGVLFSIWWQLWTKRNRRIFEFMELSVPRISRILQDQIDLFIVAKGLTSD
jgi:hypothetical protein